MEAITNCDEHEGLRHISGIAQPNPSEIERNDQDTPGAPVPMPPDQPPVKGGEVTYLPCKHCSWLLAPSEMHYCHVCLRWHTPEESWEGS